MPDDDVSRATSHALPQTQSASSETDTTPKSLLQRAASWFRERIGTTTIPSVDQQLQFIRETPLTYNSWNQFKQLYKMVEADPRTDPRLHAALIARLEQNGIGTSYSYFNGVKLEKTQSIQNYAAHGEYLFVFGGRYYYSPQALTVYRKNYDEPLQPRLMSTLALTESSNPGVQAVTFCGSYLCYWASPSISTSETQFIQIVDISHPSQPRFRGKFSVPPLVTFSAGPSTYPYLYLTAASRYTNFSELWVIDLSDPDAPRIVGQTQVADIDSEKGSPAVHGTAPFLILVTAKTASSRGLRIIDVSDPANPRSAAEFAIETPIAVATHGSFAYVSVLSEDRSKNGVWVIDVSDPLVPRLVTIFALPGAMGGITVSPDGHYVYVLTGNGNLRTLDVSDPFHPRHTGTVKGLGDLPCSTVPDEITYVRGANRGFYRQIQVVSLLRPETPRRVGDAPSGDTIGYMKRRGRRFLRQLAKTAPERYAEIATELLLAMSGKEAKINPTLHWVTLDTLFGGGTRYRQTKHGRGGYLETGQARAGLALRTREERAPAAWDARPDLLVRLLQTPDLLLPAQTFAARALRATGNQLPTLSDSMLESWLASEEPLLVALSVQAITRRLLAGETLSPIMTADAFYRANTTVRRILTQTRASGWTGNKRWAEGFAWRLAERLKPADPAQIRFARRQIDCALLLVRYFAWSITTRSETLIPLIAPFLATGHPELEAVLVAAAAKVPVAELLPWIVELSRVEPARAESVVATFVEALQTIPLDSTLIHKLIYHQETRVREIGWRLLAASATSPELLQKFWRMLLSSRATTPALTTAMGSEDALSLLERAGITAEELSGYVIADPFLVSLLTPNSFGSIAAAASPSVVLSFVAAASETQWQRLRPVWLRQLKTGVGTQAIWLVAENALQTDTSGNLEKRLLDDAEIAETFLSVDAEQILTIREPSFGPILGHWFERYGERFIRNSSLLYDAATHPLPEVRTPALERVRRLGLEMPFALRLLESAVPPSVAVGWAFFADEPVGGKHEFDHAMALADSPSTEVRTRGLNFIAERWTTLDQERVLTALFENPAPAIQAFVAAQLSGSTIRPMATPIFDAEVLRTTNRARTAKERIKVRQTAEPSLDVATLLTIARGRTPRDAEWALAELARRAAQGETIDGITVEGVIGI